jgi:ATP-dependent DNA ligase
MSKARQKQYIRDTARYIAPMRPIMVSNLPADRDKWLLEPKLDGYRVIAVKSGGRADLYSMDQKLYNVEFPQILEALQKLRHQDVILDGEIVAVEPSGRPNFNALQNRRSTKLPIYYVAFDCLHFEQRDLLETAIEERKKVLAKVTADFVKPIQPIFEFGPEVDLDTAISVVCQTKIEGLVAKRLGSRYVPGQESDLWLKHRFNQQDKFFIGGYTPGSRGIGELLIGEYRGDGKFYHVKRLIAGLNQFNRPEIFQAVQDLKTKQVPFVNLPERKSQHQHALTQEVMAECVWLKPAQPVEIEFVERTPHGRLRHAAFRRLLPRSGEK